MTISIGGFVALLLGAVVGYIAIAGFLGLLVWFIVDEITSSVKER